MVNNCSRCSKEVPQARIDEGYTICTDCSTEEKVSCHTIYPHKTGGYIQVVTKEQSQRLNRLDRRGTSVKTSKHYKPFVVEKKSEPKVYSSPIDSVSKLLSRLSDKARSFLKSANNLKEFFNSISNLIKGLNCSTRLIFEYKISGIMFPELSNSNGFSGL